MNTAKWFLTIAMILAAAGLEVAYRRICGPRFVETRRPER